MRMLLRDIMLLSCLVALALGLLIFGKLNMVTVGFSAILVGLGVDFAILIFGRYQQARHAHVPVRSRHVPRRSHDRYAVPRVGARGCRDRVRPVQRRAQ